MKKLITICLAAMVILAIGNAANAHWQPGDGSKMHYPQLPDPCGWDVSFTNTVLADDWQCSQTGYVKDIHFWVSNKGDNPPPEEDTSVIHVSIYSDIPASESGTGYSMPGTLLWDRTFTGSEYDSGTDEPGDQGWFDPVTGIATPHDHETYGIVNIENIEPIEGKPLFLQEKGIIYWLAIQVSTPTPYEDGWKTSISEHFQDDAVYLTPTGGWQELKYPSNDPLNRGGQSIDLAFVITPEPATICLLTLGGLALLRRKTA